MLRSQVLSELLEENRRLRHALERFEREDAQEARNDGSRVAPIWALLEDLFDGILVHSDGIVLEVSAKTACLLGYACEQVVDRPLTDFVADESKPALLQSLRGLASTPTSVVALRKDGSRRELIAYGRSIVQGDRVLRIVALRDVSEQRVAERSLLSSERHHRFLTENASDVIWTMDLGGRFTYVSPSVQTIRGLSAAEAREIPLSATLTRESAQRAANAIARELDHFQRTGEVRTVTIESEQLCRDGTTVWTESCAKLMPNDEGLPASILGVTRDITQRRKSDAEKQRMMNLEALGRLAGGVAHDFNNILTAILGNISLSRRSSAKGLDGVSFLVNAEKACSRARDLTQQLMAFAKGGAPVRTSASLAEVIQDSIGFAATGSPVRCSFEIPKELFRAFVDPAQIAQVLHNIALNAVQAMPTGGDLRVCAANLLVAHVAHPFLRPGAYVSISIADSGVGISPDVLPKIFDPYFTTREAGTGLGLSTCHAIVSRHEGHIEVDSTPGKGATFRVYLPAADGDNDEDSPPSSYPARGAARVLIMDDDTAVREVASLMLQSLGYDVACAADGFEAIAQYEEAKCNQLPFDVVIVDLTVPGGMGGKEALLRLKAIDSDVRVVVTSGYNEDPILADYASSGFRAMLTKPFVADEIARAVDKARA